MSKSISLEDLHQFFENRPDEHQLETQAEARLKALYNCLVNANSRTTLQIGLTGLLTYVKASQRSSIIDELLLSKDYISEIVTMAADHFLTVPLLSATCLYECMLNYPKKFSPFLINKFRPLLPRIIYKKISGPNEISCKCLAQLSVLGIPSTSKQAKSWKTEYDRYLKIASILIDQLYAGIGDFLCSDLNDIETALAAETGDLISSADYPEIFANCCHILRFLLYVQLESPVNVPTERTVKLILKVVSLNSQQFNLLHRKQHLLVLLEPSLQLCDALITFNPSTLAFNLRTMLTSIISLMDIVHCHSDYSKLTIRIYESLISFFAIYNRQIRLDVEILQKLNRWIIHDTTGRPQSKTSLGIAEKTNTNLTNAALSCLQQLLNIYSDHMPRDQYLLLQSHCLQTLMNSQLTNTNVNKPYDDEFCRVGLYQTFECLLINERADCPTIIGIGKSLIERAMQIDPSVKVKIVVRKLQIIWQQVRDSSSQLYQAWSFLNVEKPRSNFSNSHMTQNQLHDVFLPSSTAVPTPMITEQLPVAQVPSITKPTLYEPMPVVTNPLPSVSYTDLELVQNQPTIPIDNFVTQLTHNNNYEQIGEQQRKRSKIVDTRLSKVTDDDDDDGAEQIFANNDQDDDVEEDIDEMMEEDEEETDESDEVDDEDQMDDDQDSDLPSSEEDNQQRIRSNGLSKLPHHLGIHETNVDLLDINRPANDILSNLIEEDKLHKKFRRSKGNFVNFQRETDEISGATNKQNNFTQVNGAHRNTSMVSACTKGELTSEKNRKIQDDDDDEIVVVSDDEDQTESESSNTNDEDESKQRENQSMISGKKSDSSLNETNINVNRQQIEVDRSFSMASSKSSQKSTIDASNGATTLEIRETIEALRDAIVLLSDDFNPEN